MVGFLLVALSMTAAQAAVVVGNMAEFTAAFSNAIPGTAIYLRPGIYEGGCFVSQIHGAPQAPIVITALDPNNPPLFRGGGSCIHIHGGSHLEISRLVLEGAKHSGINIDDAEVFTNPSHHIALRHLVIRNTGDAGIKLAGLASFIVQGCDVSRWAYGLPAINMVGCHRGVVVACLCRHDNPEAGYGVQTKGGSENIVIRGCRFEQVGNRGVNVGGSTDLNLFRPKTQHFEARNIRVEDCTFVGGAASVAFVNAEDCVARFNTVYRPGLFAFRILQETTEPGFVACHRCQISDNIIAFRSDELQEYINVGPHTAPRTFTFARNWWYCLDRPSQSLPVLPARETDGVYGIDPLFIAQETGDLRLQPTSPARSYGNRLGQPSE